MALTLLPIDDRLFSYEKVYEEELVLAVPNSHPLLPATRLSDRKYLAVEVSILKDQKLVMLTEGQFMQRQLDNLLLDYKMKVFTAAIVKSLEAQIEFVKAGVGMALMPSGIERFCKKDDVTFYSFTAPLPKREVVVMWRRDRKLSKTADELKNIILSIDW